MVPTSLNRLRAVTVGSQGMEPTRAMAQSQASTVTVPTKAKLPTELSTQVPVPVPSGLAPGLHGQVPALMVRTRGLVRGSALREQTERKPEQQKVPVPAKMQILRSEGIAPSVLRLSRWQTPRSVPTACLQLSGLTVRTGWSQHGARGREPPAHPPNRP